MATITVQNYHDCYEYGKKVAKGIMSKKEANEELFRSGMAYTSASYYLACVCSMLNGSRYTATVKQDAVTYFFTQIYSEFGSDGLKRALTSLRGHLDYQKGKNSLPSLEKVYEEFYDIVY